MVNRTLDPVERLSVCDLLLGIFTVLSNRGWKGIAYSGNDLRLVDAIHKLEPEVARCFSGSRVDVSDVKIIPHRIHGDSPKLDSAIRLLVQRGHLGFSLPNDGFLRFKRSLTQEQVSRLLPGDKAIYERLASTFAEYYRR